MKSLVIFLGLFLLIGCGSNSDSEAINTSCQDYGFFGSNQQCSIGGIDQLKNGTPCQSSIGNGTVTTKCTITGGTFTYNSASSQNIRVSKPCKYGPEVITVTQKAYTFVILNNLNFLIPLTNSRTYVSNYSGGCSFQINAVGEAF